MTPNTLDFSKVEALRKHMLLTTTDMSELLGVSRMTYYGWVKGKPIRSANDEKVRRLLRQMLTLIRDHSWPPPDVIAAEQKQRKQRLVDMLEQLQ
jgi:DNA-binding XRE family transcriptional regulator